MVRVLGLRFCIRVSITGSVSYLNNKFVVVLAFVAPSVDHSILPGGDRSGQPSRLPGGLSRAIASQQYVVVRILGLGFCVRVSVMGSVLFRQEICSCISFCSTICQLEHTAGRRSLCIGIPVTKRRYTTLILHRLVSVNLQNLMNGTLMKIVRKTVNATSALIE